MSKNKNGGNIWENLYERPMEGLTFYYDRLGMKKLQDISNEGYALSSNGNACVLRTFKKTSAGYVIPDTIQYNLIFNIFQKISKLISSP